MNTAPFQPGDKVRLNCYCVQKHGVYPGIIYCVSDVRPGNEFDHRVKLVGREHTKKGGWYWSNQFELVHRDRPQPLDAA